MVLVADNAPYHHKWQIGCLASLTESKLVEIMESHGCDYVDVPPSDLQYSALDSGNVNGATDMGGYFRVDFEQEDFQKRISKNRPFNPNLDELQLRFPQ
jgi:hypothetical protein